VNKPEDVDTTHRQAMNPGRWKSLVHIKHSTVNRKPVWQPMITGQKEAWAHRFHGVIMRKATIIDDGHRC